MAATLTNGKPQRKQLADQLDRLDGIIDALADGLNGAVADACREGTRLAVKDAIVEILTNPELRALIVPMAHVSVPTAPAQEPAQEPKKPRLWTRLKAKVAAVREAHRDVPAKVAAAVTAPFRSAIETVNALGQVAGEALPWKKVLLVGAAVGLTVGVVCWVMPNWVAAVVGAASTSVTSVAVQTGVWLKGAAKRFGLVI